MRRLLSALLALAAVIVLTPAAAQTGYPNKPIRIIVPYPPGGATDITVRAFAPHLEAALGQPIIVEYKPGGGTNIGAAFAARQEPDGYTLYVANFASHAVNRWLFKDLTYDPLTDFTHIAMLVRTTLFACAKTGAPIDSVEKLLQLAKESPGKLTYGSPGYGSPNHIGAELLKHLAKVDIRHIPYKGAAQLNVGLLAGQVDFGFDASAIAHHHAGTLKCFGTSSPFRWPTEPNIPAVGETVPSYDLTSFFGIVGPAKMPQDIVEKLNAAFRTVAQRPDVAKALAVTGVVPFPATVKETEDFLTEQNSKWAPIVKASGAKLE